MSVTIRPARVEDSEQLLELFRSAFKRPRQPLTKRWLEWKFLSGPLDRIPGVVGVNERGRLVAARLAWAWDVVVRGRRIRAFQMTQAAVHPDFRRRGLFGKLMTEFVRRFLRDAAGYAYSPGPFNARVYRSLGFEAGRRLTWHLVFGRRREGREYSVKDVGLKTGIRSGVVGPPVRTASGGGANWEIELRQVWSEDILLWRFAGHPSIRYRCLELREGKEALGGAIVRRISSPIPALLVLWASAGGEDGADRRVLERYVRGIEALARWSWPFPVGLVAYPGGQLSQLLLGRTRCVIVGWKGVVPYCCVAGLWPGRNQIVVKQVEPFQLGYMDAL